MADFFVRKTGSDSNAGTSAGAAWATLGKALGASGIASGDTVWVGAGVYREAVLVAMTSAVAETSIIGDVDGVQTGDAGMVVWSNYTGGDHAATSASSPLNLSGRDFLTFRNLYFVNGGTGVTISGATASSTSITFTQCVFENHHTASSCIGITNGADVNASWVIDRCLFVKTSGAGVAVTLTTSTTADYDANILVRNCVFWGPGTSVSIAATGADSFKGGGVDVLNCWIADGTGVTAASANLSTTIPCTAYNNTIVAGVSTGLNANTSGQLLEDYNVIHGSTPRSNVTAGTHSIASSAYPFSVEVGQSWLWGHAPRMPFSPMPWSALLGFDGNAPASVGVQNVTRPAGTMVLRESGTATAGGAKTLTDSGKSWGTTQQVGRTIRITGGTGAGQTKTISSHTATVLTVDGNWNTQPSTDSTYIIYDNPMSSTGTATAGAASSLTDGNAALATNMWAGYTLEIMSGTGSGQTAVIASNTGTVLTINGTWGTNPDNTSVYNAYKGASITAVPAAVGAFERPNSGVKETSTVRTGSNALRITGPGVQDYVIAVNPSSTTISVYGRYNAAYAGTLPRLLVLNGTECGVADATDTMTGSADAWEELSLTFTPTSAGLVTVRLQSLSTHAGGAAFFDDFSVT